LVVAPTPYRKRKSRKLYYRRPAFLLTTDLKSSAKQLLQIYFDRWQIGVSSQGHIVQSVRDRPRLRARLEISYLIRSGFSSLGRIW
jgi:hypothetical protein